MIKYNIQLGAKHLNMKARLQRDSFLQPRLKGMHCRNCSIDTEIEFREEVSHGAMPTVRMRYLVYDIHACCSEFRERIEKKLGK